LTLPLSPRRRHTDASSLLPPLPTPTRPCSCLLAAVIATATASPHLPPPLPCPHLCRCPLLAVTHVATAAFSSPPPPPKPLHPPRCLHRC
jgi:hypothetical protein